MTIYDVKRRIVKRIVKATRPLMHETGYGVMLWLVNKRAATCKIARNFVLTNILGVTPDGVATDAFAGGLCVLGWSDIPIEDMMRLEKFIGKRIK